MNEEMFHKDPQCGPQKIEGLDPSKDAAANLSPEDSFGAEGPGKDGENNVQVITDVAGAPSEEVSDATHQGIASDAAGQDGGEEKKLTADEQIAAGLVDPVVVEALEAERQLAKASEEQLLRALADTENIRKRLERDKIDSIRYANERMLQEMLPVLDDLDLCLAHAGQDLEVAQLKQGVELTLKKFDRALQNLGVTRVDAEVGGTFDATIHEAVMQDASADLPANTIAALLQNGYQYRDRLLRPARVTVAKGVEEFLEQTVQGEPELEQSVEEASAQEEQETAT